MIVTGCSRQFILLLNWWSYKLNKRNAIQFGLQIEFVDFAEQVCRNIYWKFITEICCIAQIILTWHHEITRVNGWKSELIKSNPSDQWAENYARDRWFIDFWLELDLISGAAFRKDYQSSPNTLNENWHKLGPATGNQITAVICSGQMTKNMFSCSRIDS